MPATRVTNNTAAVFSLCPCSLRMLDDITQYRGHVFYMVRAEPIYILTTFMSISLDL
jgi:hypothetical protein